VKVLVVGASGATGRLVVEQLLSRGVEINAIVRSLDALPDSPNLFKIQASVHNLTSSEMAIHIIACNRYTSMYMQSHQIQRNWGCG